jgi:hypothetical protein
MSDSLDLLRGANPVPAPQGFANATRRRMIDAIVAHEPASQGGRFARLRRRLSRRRVYLIAVAAVLAAGGTAGAVAVLHDEPSAPLSGALPGPPGGRYSFSVTPSLGAGTVGWCIDEETQMSAPTLRELAVRLRSDLEQALVSDRHSSGEGTSARLAGARSDATSRSPSPALCGRSPPPGIEAHRCLTSSPELFRPEPARACAATPRCAIGRSSPR